MPYEIKSIYGLNQNEHIEGETIDIKGVAECENDKECTICLSVQADTIIMPCGHMCICYNCGKSIK